MSPDGTTGRFTRSDRLLDSRDFRRVLRRGRRRASAELVVVAARRQEKRNNSDDLSDSEPLPSRLGITASRKVGNAVVRNRLKRRLREWFRANRGDLAKPVDLIVMARPEGANLSLPALDRRLRTLLELPGRKEPLDG